MARKEIVYLTGKQILLGMIVLGNALVIAFGMRYHDLAIFQLEKEDLSVFSAAQTREHEVKDEIRKFEGAKSWSETDYAKTNGWSLGQDDLTRSSTK